MLKGSLWLAAVASLWMSGAAFAQEKIKVGVTATLEGTYTVLGEDGIRAIHFDFVFVRTFSNDWRRAGWRRDRRDCLSLVVHPGSR